MIASQCYMEQGPMTAPQCYIGSSTNIPRTVPSMDARFFNGL